jgi:hypothetical protein
MFDPSLSLRSFLVNFRLHLPAICSHSPRHSYNCKAGEDVNLRHLASLWVPLLDFADKLQV